MPLGLLGAGGGSRKKKANDDDSSRKSETVSTVTCRWVGVLVPWKLYDGQFTGTTPSDLIVAHCQLQWVVVPWKFHDGQFGRNENTPNFGSEVG